VLLLGEALLDEPVLGELLELEPELLPMLDDDVPPDAPVLLDPLLDLLNCASHSAREIWPSLLVSTEEKLGVEELDDEPPAADEGVDEEEEDDGLLEDDEDEDDGLVADGLELDDDGLDDDGLDDDDEDCATASVDSANITAAAVMLRPLGMEFLQEVGWPRSP